jgi:hypothetical protein
MEVNPHNEALTQLREHWQQALVALMLKHDIKETVLDFNEFRPLWVKNPPILVVIGRKNVGPHGGFKLVVAANQAEMLEIVAKKQGHG